MLYGLVITIHIIVCLVLILVILLQAGRGGGLSESFGSNITQSLFGTKANVFLTHATTASAILFIVTCLSLGILTSRRGRSLVSLQGVNQSRTVPVTIPVAPQGDTSGTQTAQQPAAGSAQK